MRTLIPFLAIALAIPGMLNAAGPDGGAVLWQQPGHTSVDDWVWGPGGAARAPKPPYEFVEEDLNGTNPKIKVRDANGNHWIVKFGGEDHSEVFAARLLFALGYVAQPSYYVASGAVSGVHGLKRAKPFFSKTGEFSYARFKLHGSKKFAKVDDRDWSWTDNPFVGTHELNGLKILLMLMSNWDAKDARDGKGSNTAIYSKPGSEGNQLYYAFDDWGATFGKWGGFFARDKWNADGFRQQSRNFVRCVDGKTIVWGYRGKHGKDITTGIGIEDVRWLLIYLSAVTDEDLRTGLRASGATAPQADAYVQSLRDRIVQLERVSQPVTASR